MAFKLPKLPYAYTALETTIDAKTMHLHHDKHHQGYVDKLNEALKGFGQYEKYSIDTLMWNLSKVDEEIREKVQNQGGGHSNHSMFWAIMTPNGGGEPDGEFGAQVKKDFRSFDKFKKEFTEAGGKQFGSGWVWVTWEDGKLVISTLPNQDTPLSDHKYPVLGNDLWEHAAYLKYGPHRDKYLKEWWQVANWKEINKRFAKAKQLDLR